MLSVLLLVHGHVPTFGGAETCVTPPHSHKISQAFYFRGTGGIEFHIKSDSDPFDTLAGEEIDVNAVFRDEVDPSTYSLYIGCGGCAPGDAIVAPRVNVTVYEVSHLEPFSVSWVRSVFPGIDWPKFNASALRLADCPERHFTIRLVDHLNRTGDRGIVYALVVGRAEKFTPGELFMFPAFALKIHGSVWNEVGFTAWLNFFLAPLVLLAVVYAVDATLLADIFQANVLLNYNLLFTLSLHGYVWSALESFTHFFLSQAKGPVGFQLFLFLALPVVWGHVVPVAWLVVSWWGVRVGPVKAAWWSSNWIGLGDIVLGVVMSFYGLGGGYWIGPIALAAAGVTRLILLALGRPRVRDGYDLLSDTRRLPMLAL